MCFFSKRQAHEARRLSVSVTTVLMDNPLHRERPQKARDKQNLTEAKGVPAATQWHTEE